MEHWFRRILESLGGKLDTAGSGQDTNLRELYLKLSPRLQRLLEQSLERDGTRYIAPHVITVALPYKLFCELSDTHRDQLAQQLKESTEQFIRDRRYNLRAGVLVQVISDVFHDSPTLRVGFEAPVSVATTSVVRPIYLQVIRTSDGQELFNQMLPSDMAIKIGRTRDNLLVIEDPSVSKFHAVLRFSPPDHLILQDLGSTNGTFLSGSPTALEGSTPIASGQVVQFGDIEVKIILE